MDAGGGGAATGTDARRGQWNHHRQDGAEPRDGQAVQADSIIGKAGGDERGGASGHSAVCRRIMAARVAAGNAAGRASASTAIDLRAQSGGGIFSEKSTRRTAETGQKALERNTHATSGRHSGFECYVPAQRLHGKGGDYAAG